MASRIWRHFPARRCCRWPRGVRRRYTLNSWDRMMLPLPFGRGVLVCLPPLAGRPPRHRSGVGAARGAAH
ncbi:MAG: hypothetical protein WDN04_27210 [Rhodospirillales bacterium]